MLSLPFFRHGEGDLVLGRTGPFPFSPLYRVLAHARSTHMYVIGITGKGKSKLLEHCLFQDVRAGRGCVLIDPHGDLVQDVLRLCLTRQVLDPDDVERLIYFDPTRKDYIVPFNVLNTPGEPYEVAQRVVEAFRRTWPESLSEAPHFSNVATAALMTLIAHRLTLTDMHRLLVEPDWREKLLERVDNSEVVSFFRDRYDRWGREAPVLRESTLNKVAAFTFNPYLRLVLGQRENHLDLRRIMDEGKVLLVDLGQCDGETRRLLGSLLVTGLEQAAASRQDVPQEARTPCYAYIDEFQDFAANPGSVKSLAQILSECRKFGLHLTLAHQNLSQLSERMWGAIGNIQTRVIFGVARQDAEWFAHEVGRVDTRAIKHEPQTETQHPVFAPLAEQWEEWTALLKYQPARQAFVAAHDGSIRRIWTMPISPYTATDEAVEEMRRSSLRWHGIPYAQAQRNLKESHEGQYPSEAIAPPMYEEVSA
jgi:hypothetical protein